MEYVKDTLVKYVGNTLPFYKGAVCVISEVYPKHLLVHKLPEVTKHKESFVVSKKDVVGGEYI